mgnify:CR=1 FL=1
MLKSSSPWFDRNLRLNLLSRTVKCPICKVPAGEACIGEACIDDLTHELMSPSVLCYHFARWESYKRAKG